jgi:hypothetical protein
MLVITFVLVATSLLSLMSHSARWLGFGAALLLCLCYPIAASLLLLILAVAFLVVHFFKRKSNHAVPKLPPAGP